MIPENRVKFLEVVIGLAELKGKSLSAPALELYWNAMQDWRIEEFKQAAAHLVSTCAWMPEPKDFQDLRRRAAQFGAPEAWTLVLRCVRSGDYQTGRTIGGRADRVVAVMGGYQYLAMSNTTDTHFREKRFHELWAELGETEEARAALPQLVPPEVRPRLSGPRRVVPLITRQQQ